MAAPLSEEESSEELLTLLVGVPTELVSAENCGPLGKTGSPVTLHEGVVLSTPEGLASQCSLLEGVGSFPGGRDVDSGQG